MTDELGLIDSVSEFPREDSKRRKEIMAGLLERFKLESGWQKAKVIDWNQLDRSQIPVKYDGIIINGSTMRITRFFRNPEIVNNVHFTRYTEEELVRKSKIHTANKWQKIKNTRAEPEDKIEYDRAFEKVLETFRTDSGNLFATEINWRRIDKSKLPEKYTNALITTDLFYQMGYYKDPEFMDNVHFQKYSKWYVRTKRKYMN